MKPEHVIRRYLDDHGGSVDARVDHLRVSFQLDELTREGQARIAEALAQVGVRAEPPLGRLDPQDRLRLRLAKENGASVGRDQAARPDEESGTDSFAGSGGAARGSAGDAPALGANGDYEPAQALEAARAQCEVLAGELEQAHSE